MKYLNNVIKKRSIAFLISDLMDEGYGDALKIANRRHDLVVLRCTDPREMELPNMGLVQFSDPETGEARWVNTRNKAVRNHYRAQALKHQARSRDALHRAGVDHAVISTREGYVKPLMNLFRQRDQKRRAGCRHHGAPPGPSSPWAWRAFARPPRRCCMRKASYRWPRWTAPPS